MRKIIPVLILLALVISTAAAAFTIRAETGETYIRWSWPTNNTFDVYVDGKIYSSNTTLNYVYITDLSPKEEHRLDLMNVTETTTPFKTSVTSTNAPSGLIWITLLITLGLTVLLIFMEGWPVILIGSVVEVLGIFGRGIAYNYYGADWLFVVFMVVAGVCIAYNLYTHGRKEIAWY